MIAAPNPARVAAKLLHIDARGKLRHAARDSLVDYLRRDDVVIANDAATLPASLHGVHERTGAGIEVRLAGSATPAIDNDHAFIAIVFGAGDYRTRTEHRAPPPALLRGDRLILGDLTAVINKLLDHPRLVSLEFEACAEALWQGLAQHGRPIQYAHVPQQLEMWDVWTAIANAPVAFEAPSAGFALDWRALRAMHDKGIVFRTLTHAAGISSTGDVALDERLPLDEPYFIPATTAVAINKARGRAQRIVAIGTTVVRALEHAGESGIIRAGPGLATQRLGAHSQLRIVDAILSGTHERGTSHYELLRAFAADRVLHRADAALLAHDYRTHEFGDSVLIERGVLCDMRSERLAARPIDGAAVSTMVSRAHYDTLPVTDAVH